MNVLELIIVIPTLVAPILLDRSGALVTGDILEAERFVQVNWYL